MKLQDLTNEQIEKAKTCTTREEKLAFLKEYSIELPDDLLDEVSGGSDATHCISDGVNDCPNSPSAFNTHEWERTGRTKPGEIFGELWPDHEERCVYCGALQWSKL